ncbi:MAG: hypothetical protein E7668_06690 [Ruminococcaceae bacterium]|nr:hypothetical protein [Oscillospiraceae bacterium]
MNGTMKRNNMNGFAYLESECPAHCFEEVSETMENENNIKDVLAENCKFSGFSMVSVAGGLLMCAGIILYALLGV